jgi:hypothetical protein
MPKIFRFGCIHNVAAIMSLGILILRDMRSFFSLGMGDGEIVKTSYEMRIGRVGEMNQDQFIRIALS